MTETRSPRPSWSEKSSKVEGMPDSHAQFLESPDSSPRSLKRDHDTYEGTGLYEPMSVPADFREMIERERAAEANGIKPNHEREVSPVRSTTESELSDLGTATPREGTPSIGVQGNAFAALNGTTVPPAKKQKLTFQEQEMRRINKQIRDGERAEERERKEGEKLRKEVDRQAIAVEKARRERENEVEKQKKETEREVKRQAAADEKAKKEAEKEEKRKKKEEEKNKKEEEKKKASKGQLKMTGFVKLPPSASKPRPTSTERRTASPGAPNSGLAASLASPSTVITPSKASKPQLSAYERTFPPFFVREGVKVAPNNHFERDDAALEAAQKSLDSYILGNRSPGRERHLDPVELFKLPSHLPLSRGTRVMPVKEIIEEFYSGKPTKVIDLTTDSQNSQIRQTTSLLRKIPMKFLKFQEDVRPPYQGTYSKRPHSGMTKIAKNPFLKDLPHPTNYDWDSEAEWEEDADAEDLKSEGDEDEEVDDDEDMDGFLDDENDEISKGRRLVLQGDLEPICSGLCWEDRKKRNENVKMQQYRMEMILDPAMKSIDPFSAAYWEPTAAQITSMNPPRVPLNNLKPSSLSHNGSISSTNASSKNVKTFPPAASSLPISKPRGRPAAPSDKPKKLIEEKEMHKFKEAIKEFNDMSKIGIIELLKKRFPGQKAAQIKNTLEVVARRVGNKEVDKRWVVIDDDEGIDQQLGSAAIAPVVGIEAYGVRPDPFSI